jgi:hypothetical protein
MIARRAEVLVIAGAIVALAGLIALVLPAVQAVQVWVELWL